MEEMKQTSRIKDPLQAPTEASYERDLKARINNNCHLMKTQAHVFRNISSTDALLAYSLSNGCQSLAKTKHQQIMLLMQTFKKSKDTSNKDDRETFKNVIRNKFQEVAEDNDEMEIDNEEGLDDDDVDDEDSDEEFDEDEEAQQQQQQTANESGIQVQNVQQQQQLERSRSDVNMEEDSIREDEDQDSNDDYDEY